MKASSLSGECARRNSTVLVVAAGVDMCRSVLALTGYAHTPRWAGETLVREPSCPLRSPWRANRAIGVRVPVRVPFKSSTDYHTDPGCVQVAKEEPTAARWNVLAGIKNI